MPKSVRKDPAKVPVAPGPSGVTEEPEVASDVID